MQDLINLKKFLNNKIDKNNQIYFKHKNNLIFKNEKFKKNSVNIFFIRKI